MKRFFRCCTVMLGAGIALTLLAGVVLYFVGVKKLTQSYPNIPVETVNVPVGADAIARGEHIAIIWGCTKCHAQRYMMTGKPAVILCPECDKAKMDKRIVRWEAARASRWPT